MVIALGALLLLIVFRSPLIPIKAAAMNLLSIGAYLGVMQAVFERGWAASLLGFQKGPIDAFFPVLAFAIIFGLSTDDEVFLVSHIHEEWRKRPEPVSRSARVSPAPPASSPPPQSWCASSAPSR